MPIEIVFDMLGFNMLNPKMKNHPPFVLPRLANMQRSQHTNLLKKKTAFDFFACLSYSCGPQRLTKVANAHIWILLTATMLTLLPANVILTLSVTKSNKQHLMPRPLQSAKTYNAPPCFKPLQSAKTYTAPPCFKHQHYSVLQSTTPVPLCTTKYYSGTRKYCSSTTPVLQSTTPVLICTTKYLHTWHVIYNARSNKSQPPTSATTAPATQNDSRDQSATHLKRYLQCAEQQVASSNITKYCACHAKWLSWLILVTYETLFTMRRTTDGILQHHRILRLPRKMILQNFRNISPKQMKRQLQCATDPRMIRAGSDHETVIRNPPRNRGYFSRPPRPFCIENYNISRSGYHSKFHRILRLPRKGTLQHHRILRLPRKMTVITDPRHIMWNVISNAVSSWNISEYCACHAKWLSNISKKFLENSWNVISNAGPIRAWSELDPSWIRAGNRHPQPASQPRLLFRTTTSILYWKIQHFALRLSFQISPNTAPATKSDTSTSPNTAPATQNDSHHWSS